MATGINALNMEKKNIMRNNNRKQRRYLTLIEMMIVMFIIASITGVLGYRYASSLDEAKAFKTKTAIERVSSALNLEAAQNPDFLSNIQSEWQAAVANSPLGTNNSKDLLRDGWGVTFEVYVENGNIIVRSQKFDDYTRNNPKYAHRE
jgi:general secretion pathway protein G